MTGHGNVVFSEEEAENIRTYLYSGGFLHIDDNYGMAPYLKKALQTIFPEKELLELDREHAIFNSAYPFPDGLPKIHEHDNKRPQALGLFEEERLIVLYTFESDLGDGWEDEGVHHNPQDVRTAALQMGTNIIVYALSQ